MVNTSNFSLLGCAVNVYLKHLFIIGRSLLPGRTLIHGLMEDTNDEDAKVALVDLWIGLAEPGKVRQAFNGAEQGIDVLPGLLFSPYPCELRKARSGSESQCQTLSSPGRPKPTSMRCHATH